MARQRQRPGRREIELTYLQLLNFRVGCGRLWDDNVSDRERQQVYERYRDQLVTLGNEGPLHSYAFWQLEPGVPDELREDPPEAPYHVAMRALTDAWADPELTDWTARREDHLAARRAWLRARAEE